MKKVAMLVTIAFVFTSVLFAQQAYNRDRVVTVMRENRNLVGLIQTALRNNNFSEAETHFFRFAELNAEIQAFNPPKGDKKEWDRIMGASVGAAIRGVLASRNRNATAADAAIKEMVALSQEGHRMFR